MSTGRHGPPYLAAGSGARGHSVLRQCGGRYRSRLPGPDFGSSGGATRRPPGFHPLYFGGHSQRHGRCEKKFRNLLGVQPIRAGGARSCRRQTGQRPCHRERPGDGDQLVLARSLGRGTRSALAGGTRRALVRRKRFAAFARVNRSRDDRSSSAGRDQGDKLPTRTVDPSESPVLLDRCAGARTDAERLLAEVLADVLRADRVSVDSHFFDELGADSLVMAHFCARVRKRGDLPSVSMRDIYRHPTIRSLAAALADIAPRPANPSASAAIEAPTPTLTREYILCGALQ